MKSMPSTTAYLDFLWSVRLTSILLSLPAFDSILYAPLLGVQKRWKQDRLSSRQMKIQQYHLDQGFLCLSAVRGGRPCRRYRKSTGRFAASHAPKYEEVHSGKSLQIITPRSCFSLPYLQFLICSCQCLRKCLSIVSQKN